MNYQLTQPSKTRATLISDGYVVIPNFFSLERIAEARSLLEELAGTRSQEYFSEHVRIGSLIDITESVESLRLIASEELIGLFALLGFCEPVFQYGLGFVKHAGAPRSFWHQDGTLWGTTQAYQSEPLEVGALVYLQDTTPSNGCMVVLPGSHRRAHPIHQATDGIPHATWRNNATPDALVYRPQAEEVPIQVRAGDLVLLDMRLLHATRPNLSDEQRGLITLVYFGNWNGLPESVHARYAQGVTDSWSWMPKGIAMWPEGAREAVKHLLPRPYSGPIAPEPVIAHPITARMQDQ
jgi:phytanoyl-CoA hydroxylase